MAPCQRYTFDECMEVHGMDYTTEEQRYDADLLCGVKGDPRVETISAASAAIVIYLIANVYIQIAECSVLLKRSRIWGRGKEHEKEANRAIVHSTIYNCVLGLFLYVGSTVAVVLLTRPLDRRTNSIVVGLSQIFAAIVFFMMSVNVPQWFGVYHSNKNTMVSFTSGRGIRFSLSWNIWKQLSSMYFFNLYFSCADNKWNVVYGVLIGIVAGVVSVVVAKKARSKKFAKSKHILAVVVIVCYALGSSYSFFSGVLYIAEIWVSNENYTWLDSLYISLGWLGIVIVGHAAMYVWTSKKQKAGASMRFTSQHFDEGNLARIVSAAVEEQPDSVVPPPRDDPGGGEEETTKNAPSGKNERSVGFADGTKTEEVLRPPGGVGYVAPDLAPSYWVLLMTKLAETFPFVCCCLQKTHGLENIARSRLDYIDRAREKTPCGKCLVVLKRFAWYLLSAFFLFFTVVNIGASYQQCAAKNALGPTFAVLYPPDYLDATMCAWDEPGPNATIKTFDTLQDVRDANYKVVHCGACGTCSNWNDIELQYTSRKVLAGITKVCAKKSIGRKTNFTDPNDPVVECNHLRVGFTMPCAMSWAWDEINTKNHAIFVFLQAQLTNSFADMAVTYQDITMATIDEAISGRRFQPEVGATRRRMNIVSDIKRASTQQCTIVEQDWEQIFVDPFRPPIGGTYYIQSPGEPTAKVVVVGQDSAPS